ncbi:LysR family transcriptional regulator [Azoarcus sp. L1K30]|uniref:LysR family transcriptional regulator n=1 Tax=Azoarcus sp. L1K30 TaxID=2820277 RepID=UPI001B81E387|nr:LysR family transcriptional regulator [Azoarcus sp. L1K30]MBR0567062.1 LysR family transcriptional regulator [Azoarcus sp. L1K30]
MELYHLRTFVTVAEERHLTRAADRLFVSQPAISAHIKALEDELGLALFERTPKGMVPTAAGEALAARARHALSAVAEIGLHAQELRGEVIGSVRIGLNTDASFLKLVELQQLLKARHPRLDLEFLGGTTGANMPKLNKGRLDASFVSGAVDDTVFDSQVLREEEMAIAAPTALRDAIGDADIATLARQPWIHSSPDRIQHAVMQAMFEPHGLQPIRSMLANQKDAVLALVAAGVGLAITRRQDIERAAEAGAIYAIPLPLQPVPTVSLRFACLKRRADEPLLRAVSAAVRSVWTEHAAP